MSCELMSCELMSRELMSRELLSCELLSAHHKKSVPSQCLETTYFPSQCLPPLNMVLTWMLGQLHYH